MSPSFPRRLILAVCVSLPVLFLVSLLVYKTITGQQPGPLQRLTSGLHLSLSAPEYAQEGSLVPLILEVTNRGAASVLVRSACPTNTPYQAEYWLTFPGSPLAGTTFLPSGGYLRSALIKPGETQRLTILYRPVSENTNEVKVEVALSRESLPGAFQVDQTEQKALVQPGGLAPPFRLSVSADIGIAPGKLPHRDFQNKRHNKEAYTYSSWLQAWIEQTPTGVRAVWPQNVEETLNGLDFHVIDFIDVSASDVQLITVISREPMDEDLLKRLSERFNPTPYLGPQEIAPQMRYRVRLSHLRYCFRELLAARYKISVEKHDGVAIITARN